MNRWWIALILLIAYIYLSYYYRYPSKVSILQTSLSRFDLNLFQEKQPIVLEDAVKNFNPLSEAWFKWNIKRPWSEVLPEQWMTNKYKYLWIHPQEPIEVFLYPPSQPWKNNQPDPEQTIIILKLKAHKLLMVPYHWKWMIETEKKIEFIGIHDAITWVLP